MAYTEKEQVFALVEKSRRILITIKQDWSGDALAGALALASYLKSIGKEADVVCDGFAPAGNLQFLPTSDVQPTLEGLQTFAVKINCENAPLGDYDCAAVDGNLNINLNPKSGRLTRDDISFFGGKWKYDLIFLVNTSDLNSLGSIFSGNSDFFYSTPKINIDHDFRNEHFGNINLVDLAACSSSEIVCELIREQAEEMIEADLATALYAGMVMATKNFKTGNVTPQVLNLAGWLISRGAARDQIVTSLYRSRFLSTLKLWGRILSRLSSNLNERIVSSALSYSDFIETGTSAGELDEVVDELIASLPKAEIIALFFETKNQDLTYISVNVYSVSRRDAVFLCRNFNPTGNKDIARFIIKDIDLLNAERYVIEELKLQM